MTGDLGSIGDIVAFVSAAESGGFSAAAKRLGRSRSAVAKAVARLEARLGTRLMTRSTRRFAVTDAGRRYRDRCADLIRGLRDAEAEIAIGGAAPRGTLRIAAPDGYGRSALLPVIGRYLERHAEVGVELTLSDRIGNLVEEGWDIAIRVGRLSDLPPELVARPIDRLPHSFVAAPAYLERHGTPASLDAMSGHEVITYGAPGPRARWRVLNAGGDWNDRHCRSRLAVDSAAGILEAARLGLGIAYLPHRLAEPSIKAGDLIVLFPGEAVGALPVTAVFQSRRQPAKVRAFLALLRHA